MPDPAELLSTPWLYPALFAMAVLDAFVFLTPSELLIPSAGTIAAAQDAEPFVIVLADAAGAVAGDHLPYQLGRTAPCGPDVERHWRSASSFRP